MEELNIDVAKGAVLATIAAHFSALAIQSVIDSEVGANNVNANGDSIGTSVFEERFLADLNLGLTLKGAL